VGLAVQSKLLRDSSVQLRPYNAATQQRQIRDRLHALDLINERFSRAFRVSLFSLLRRSSDVTVESVTFINADKFNEMYKGPMSFNVVSMKPLRGNALISFPGNLIYMAVDTMFGGNSMPTSGQNDAERDFSLTEQRITLKLLRQAMDTYKQSWRSVFPIEPEYVRSETISKFANISSSQSETLIHTSLVLEIGTLQERFSITFPYAMIEPIRPLLSNMVTDHYNDDIKDWNHQMSSEIRDSRIELTTNFLYIDSSINEIMALQVGDVLPVKLPNEVVASVNGVPVVVCEYGTDQGRRALRVKETINHALLNPKPPKRFVKGASNEVKDIHNE
jgi:flagellar motor switch protein FliM